MSLQNVFSKSDSSNGEASPDYKKHQYQLVLIIFLFAYFGSKLILNEHICDHVT